MEDNEENDDDEGEEDDEDNYEDGDDDDKGQPLTHGWVGGSVEILDGHRSTFPDFSAAIITQLRLSHSCVRLS